MEDWFDTEKIFSDNGGKIKRFAEGLYLGNLIVYLLGGGCCIFLSFFDIEWLWWLIPVGGIVIALARPLAYLSTCFIYGYGELVSNSYGSSNSKAKETVKETAKKEKVRVQPQTFQKFKCYSCGNRVAFGDANCKNCGAPFDWSKI